MKKYHKTYSVILDNMDMQEYTMRPIAVITYVQDAFARFTATKRMAAYDLFKKNLFWVVAEINLEFVDTPPYWSEEIEAEVWFSEISRLKIYYDFKISWRGKVFAKGDSCWYILDQKTRKPCKTDEFADELEINNEFALSEHKKFTLGTVGEKVTEIVHKTNLSDIDFNNHVNNKSYLNLAERTVPPEYTRTHALKNFSIKFNRETFFGDTLTCIAYKSDKENSFIHKIMKDEIDVCDITSSWIEKIPVKDIAEAELKVKEERKE